MKKGICGLSALVLVLLFLAPGQGYCSDSGSKYIDEFLKGPGHQLQEKSASKNYREGDLLVKFKTNTSETKKKNLHKKHQSENIKEFPSLNIHHVKHKKDLSVEEAMNLYKSDPDVEYAEPNYIVSSTNGPNDPWFPNLWGLYNTGQTGGIIRADIHAPEAWDITTGNHDVVVAVIDTGIDYTHLDLAANMWVNTGEIANNGIDDDGNGYVDDVYGINTITGSGNVADDYGHGTHVAGTIGATGNNGIGVVGVNWDVKIMACKFLDSNGSGSIADAVECLEYVRKMKDKGVNIVATNNSWGLSGCTNCFSQALYDAVSAQRDILFIAAAGNRGANNEKDNIIPANFKLPNVVSVAATDSYDNKASFSSYGGSAVHIGAPGVDVISLRAAGTDIYRDSGHFIPAGDHEALYYKASGTSMAAPHVAGLAALLRAQDPNRSWIDIKNLLLSGGDNVFSMEDATITGKRINAYGSLACSNNKVLAVVKRPDSAAAGTPVTLSALSINCASSIGPVTVTTSGGDIIQLHDDGAAPDMIAGDGMFAGTWTPKQDAELLTFASPAGTQVIEVPQLTILPYVMDGNTNSFYSNFLAALGGSPPYTWSIISGSLPPGLILNNSTGEISGYPTTVGYFYFTVNTTDSFNMTSASELLIHVDDSTVPGIWGKAYGSKKDNYYAYKVVVDQSGNSYVAGDVLVKGDNTWDTKLRNFVIKYNASGTVLWTKLFDENIYIATTDIALDASGNVYFGGIDRTAGHSIYKAIKYDPSGNVLWTGAYENGHWVARTGGVAVDNLGNVYLTGTDWNGIDYDFMLIKFDSSGHVLWARTYDNGMNQYADHITLDTNGDIYASGFTYQVDSAWNFQYDFLTVKWSSSGDLLWVDLFDSGQYDWAWGIVSDSTGIYLLGNTGKAEGASIIKKYTTSGEVLWTIPLIGISTSIFADGNGYIYVSGIDGISRFDSSGTLVWNKYCNLTGNINVAIAADSSGSVYTAGFINAGGGDYYSVAIKYQQDIPVTGTCGSSSGKTLNTVPTSNLCIKGIPSAVNGSGPWTWSCGGINGGTTASCSANIQTYTITPTVSSGGTISPASRIVNHGSLTSFEVSTNEGYVAGVSGTCGGSISNSIYTTGIITGNCSESITFKGNGKCGSSNGQTLTTAPADLCSVGTASTVSGSGPWTWSCGGVNGGTTVSCSAYIQTYTITPSVSSGGTIYPASRTVNHGGAATFTLTLTSGYFASLSGTCGGSIANNVYTTGVITGDCSESITFICNGACGSSNGQTSTTPPTLNLCSKGTASAIDGSGPWTWNCEGINGGTTASCSANIKTYTIIPSVGSGGAISPANLTVKHGSTGTFTLTPNYGYVASINGTCGGSISDNVYTTGVITGNCSESVTFKGNGKCGSSNGQTLTAAPADLCSVGTESAVTGSGPWTWSCFGVNGGTTAICSANIQTYTITPSVSSGGSISPAILTVKHGSTGTFTLMPDSGYFASLSGTCGGSIANNVYTTGVITGDCSESITFICNGVCGSSNGQILTAPPTQTLCNRGTASSVEGSGPWTWSCEGINGGTTASCSANIKTYTITPSVSSGGAITPSSRTVNYGSTTTFSLTPNNGYDANISGTCGGSISNNIYTTGIVTANCSESITFKGNGSCGSANGQTLTTAPTSDFCNIGTSSWINGSGPWTWSCGGVNGGTTVGCSASIQTYTITPSVSSGGTISPAILTVKHGSTGTFMLMPNSGYAASISGACGGSITNNVYTTGVVTGNCSESITFICNGTCGSSNGQILTTPPTLNLCSAGILSEVTGSGPWTWSCAGVNGGTTVSCSANIQTYTITPSVSSGGTISPASRTVNYGSTGMFTLTPNSEYIAGISGTCGGSIVDNVYTTGAITSDCSEIITFKSNGKCSGSSGQTLTAPPTDLCNAGAASTVTGNGPWAWSCAGANGGTTASCTANMQINGSCGSTNGQILMETPSSNLCSKGTASLVSGSGPWTWSCDGINGGTTASCSAYLKINGICGSANDKTLTAAPTSNLCSEGTASTVSGNSPWTWSCAGVNGGTTAKCSANVQTYIIIPTVSSGGSISPKSWAVNHGNLASFVVSPNNGYTASVSGACGGSIVNNIYTTGVITGNCSATLTFKNNGVCGSSNGQTLAVQPTTNLCISGAALEVSGSGPWTWTCAGENGGSIASCSANKKIDAEVIANGPYYAITSTVNNGGAVKPSSQAVKHGSKAYFTVKAEAGYHLVSVTGCGGELIGDAYTTETIKSGCNIAATFEANDPAKLTHTITALSGLGGSVSCAPVTVDHNSNSICAIYPDDGYHIADVKIDDKSVGAIESYEFLNVTAGHILVVAFAADTETVQYKLTVKTAGAGNGSISCKAGDNDEDDCTDIEEIAYAEGTKIVLIQTPDDNSMFKGWSGHCKGKSATCTIIMNGDKTVTANYEAAEAKIFVSPTSIKFGTGKLNKTKTKKLKITNKGNAVLKITGITTDGDFTADWDQQEIEIQPKKSVMLTVTFTPTMTGNQTGPLGISSNDPDKPLLEMQLVGKGVK